MNRKKAWRENGKGGMGHLKNRLYTTMRRNILRKKSMRKGRNAMKHRNVKNKENVEIY